MIGWALYNLLRPDVWPACNTMLLEGYNTEPNDITKCVNKIKDLK